MKAPECADCLTEGIVKYRPIVSGVRMKRCASHDRAHKKQAKTRNHGRMIERVYSLTAEQYELLYQAQGGRCAICQVATGKTRRLAVEHDHLTGEVFGLCCGPCNIMLGRLGRGVEAYLRVVSYLYDPPARRVLGPIYVPE